MTEDECDAEVARRRLQEIKDNPDLLVTGEALKARLDAMCEEGAAGVAGNRC